MSVVKRLLFVFTGLAFAFATFTSIGAPVSAVEVLCDYDFFDSNNVAFWDPCESTSCSGFNPGQLSAESNLDYKKKQILNMAQMAALEKNLPIYKKAASPSKIPWQLLATLHIVETGLLKTGPSNGHGPYQVPSETYKIGVYDDADFEDASTKAAVYIKGLAEGRDLSKQENVKYVLFKHSGAQEVYIQQAKDLGFTDEQAAVGEGSPYVMNTADAQRDPTLEGVKTAKTWGELKNSTATTLTYPAKTYYGAYIVYASIAGIKLSGGCNGGLVSGGMDIEEANAFMRTYIDSPDSVNYLGGAWSDPVFGPLANCVSFSNYFVNKYTTFRSTSGMGATLAGNFLSVYPEVPSGTEPQPYSLFSTPGPTSDGHTGIILGVNEEAGTMIVGDQAWGAELRLPREMAISDFNRRYGQPTYAYLSDYLKEDL